MAGYKAAPPAALRIVPLDALTLIYHRASGITHVVDSPVPEMIAALGSDTLTDSKGVKLLILNPRDPEGLVAAADAATKAGVKVVVMDSAINPKAHIVTQVRSSNDQNGYLVGQWLAKRMQGKPTPTQEELDLIKLGGTPKLEEDGSKPDPAGGPQDEEKLLAKSRAEYAERLFACDTGRRHCRDRVGGDAVAAGNAGCGLEAGQQSRLRADHRAVSSLTITQNCKSSRRGRPKRSSP